MFVPSLRALYKYSSGTVMAGELRGWGISEVEAFHVLGLATHALYGPYFVRKLIRAMAPEWLNEEACCSA